MLADAGKFAVILGDRVLIAGGDFGRIGVADRAALIFVELAAQLQFERIHLADELLVHLLDQSGIAGETARDPDCASDRSAPATAAAPRDYPAPRDEPG